MPKTSQKKRGKKTVYSPETIARARVLYEMGATNCAIGAEVGVGESTIRSWVKRYEWTRDLAKKARKNADLKLFIQDAGLNPEAPLSEDDQAAVVQAATSHIIQVIESHRGLIKKHKTRFEALASQIDERLRPQGEDGEPVKITLEQLENLVKIYKDLTHSLRIMVQLERQSWGLKDEEVPEEGDEVPGVIINVQTAGQGQ